MELARQSAHVYRFGPFEAVAETGELRKDGTRVKLLGQPCQILVMLLEANGEVVTREALRTALWSSDTFVDFEHSLNTAVKKLRQALGDNADEPLYIETVPRVGYRFLAPHGKASRTAEITPIAVATVAEPKRRTSARWLAIGCVAAAILVAAFAIIQLTATHELRITGSQRLTFHVNEQNICSSISSDGKRVYFFKTYDLNLYSVPVGGGPETSTPTRFLNPIILHISPDGTMLLVKEFMGPTQYASRLWLLPTGGGPAHPLGDIQVDFAGAWAPDGKSIAFAQQNTIYVTNDLGATYHPIIEAPGTVSWLRWSPDGERLRFTVADLKTDTSSIWEAKPNGKPTQVPLNVGKTLGFGSWTRDGKYFIFLNQGTERAEYFAIAQGRTWFGTEKPTPLASVADIYGLAPSPTENRFFIAEHQDLTRSFRFDATHKILAPFLEDRSLEDPAFSADGQWLAYIDQHGPRNVLMRSRADGSDPVALTDPQLYARFPHFSSDGKRIAFMGKVPGKPWQIYWISTDGGALHAINAPEVVSQADASWLPDGKTLLFGQTVWYMADPKMPRAIYLHDLESGSLKKVPDSDGWFSPRIAPDGRSFVALTADEAKLGLYDFAAGKWRTLLANSQRVAAPYWSADGNFVYVNMHRRDTVYERGGTLVRIRVSDGTMEDVMSLDQYLPDKLCNSWGLAPDGAITVSCFHANSEIYALQYE